MGGKVDLHFNTNTNNKGRYDLRPVCIKAKEEKIEGEVKSVGGVCDKATIISTYAQCKSAIKTLGYKLTNNPWTGNYGEIPYGCSFREMGGKVDLHFNTNTNNKGRGDLRPVCIKAKEASTEEVSVGISSGEYDFISTLQNAMILFGCSMFMAFLGYKTENYCHKMNKGINTSEASVQLMEI